MYYNIVVSWSEQQWLLKFSVRRHCLWPFTAVSSVVVNGSTSVCAFRCIVINVQYITCNNTCVGVAGGIIVIITT